MSTEPLTPEALAAVEALLTPDDDPIRFLLDGLAVADLAELRYLVDLGRKHRPRTSNSERAALARRAARENVAEYERVQGLS